MPAFLGARAALMRSTALVRPILAFIPWVNFFTDLGQDVDDAGALALLIVLHRQGKIVLSSVTVTPTTGRGPSVARLMLDFAGLWDVPVAGRRGSDVYQPDYMNADMTSFYGYPALNADYPAPVTMLRQSLKAAPDKGAIICVVGPVPDLYDLLQSPADGIDSRTGNALVKDKCQRVIFMGGGTYQAGVSPVKSVQDFNWSFKPETVNPVLQALQTMGMEAWCAEGRWGADDAFSGPLLSAASNGSDPLKKAYDVYQKNNGASIRDTSTRRTRASWDVVAALATVGLADRFSTVSGFMSFDQPGNNTSSWVSDPAGNFKFLLPTRSVASIMDDLNAFYDAYGRLGSPLVAPDVSITEVSQGSVVVKIARQFFAAWTYSTDGTTYQALPSDGTLTTLTPDQAYTLSFKSTRYGVPSPVTTLAYKTKPVVGPTSIATVPGVIRYFDFRDKANIAPSNVSSTVRLTSVTDLMGSGKNVAPDGSQGPIYVTTSSFGTNRPGIRSVNGDAAGGNVTGAYARIFGDLPELAGKTDYAVFFTIAVQNDRNDNGRIFSLAPNGSQDWSSSGFAFQVPSSNRNSISLYGKNQGGGTTAITHDKPFIGAVIVKGGLAQLRVNGVDIGNTINLGALGSAPRFGFLRQVDTDAGCIFGDSTGIVIVGNAPTIANIRYIEAKLCWDGLGNGSLLPSDNPYQTTAP